MVDMKILRIINYKNISKWNVSDLIHKNLSGKYENFSLCNFLDRDKTVVNIQDDVLYKQITVHQYGEGVSLRCEKKGKEIGTKRQFLAKKGQLIVSGIDARNGSVGLITDYLEGGIVTNDFWLFNLRNANSEFMQLLLSSKMASNYLQSKSNGTTNRQRINIQDFLQIKMPVPPLEKQKVIIKKYNDAITEAENLEKQAEEVEKSINTQLLDLLFINRSIKSEKTNAFLKFRKLSKCERWDVDYLIGKNTIDYIYTSKYPIVHVKDFVISTQYGSSSKADRNSANIPVLRMNNIQKGELNISDLKYLSLNDKDLNNYKLHKGDFLFNRTNSKELVGKTAIFDLDGDYVFASYLIRIILDTSKVNIYYVNYLFGSIIVRDQIDLISRQILGQANVNVDEMKDFIIPLPPLSVQNEIVSHINEIKENVKSLRKQASDLRTKAKQDFENTVFN